MALVYQSFFEGKLTMGLDPSLMNLIPPHRPHGGGVLLFKLCAHLSALPPPQARLKPLKGSCYGCSLPSHLRGMWQG